MTSVIVGLLADSWKARSINACEDNVKVLRLSPHLACLRSRLHTWRMPRLKPLAFFRKAEQ